MQITVETLENSFRVRFPYNPDAVSSIKVIPGKQFHADTKSWMIPKTSEKALQRFLNKFSGKDALAEIKRPYVDVSKVYPTCSKTTPWAHQLEALRYLWNKEAALVHLEMGIGGKSRIIVDFVNNYPILRTLILCPLAVVPVWPGQFETHGGLPSRVISLDSGSVAQKQAKAQAAFEAQAKDHRNTPVVLVMNYDAVWRDPFAEWILDQDIGLLVTDECQRVKAKGGRAALFCYRLASGVPVRVGLSGTPFPHSPADAYGVYRVLEPKIFGTSSQKFHEAYFYMGGFENRQVGGLKADMEQEFQHKIDSIRFHVQPDASSLPGELHTEIPVELPAPARKVYRQLANDFYAKVEGGEVSAPHAAAALVRLQQLTSGYLPVEVEQDDETLITPPAKLQQMHIAKTDALFDLLFDVPLETAVVVFCRFHWDLDMIHVAASKLGRKSRELSGRKSHPLQVKLPGGKWQEGPETVLATQLKAGSVGVDLTRSHISVFLSYTFSLEEYEQSLRRTRRPGQTHTCLYYHICVTNSVDGRMRKALETRKNVIDALLERH